MAVKADTSPFYWSQVERGVRSPTIDFLARASYFLNVSLSSLFEDL